MQIGINIVPSKNPETEMYLVVIETQNEMTDNSGRKLYASLFNNYFSEIDEKEEIVLELPRNQRFCGNVAKYFLVPIISLENIENVRNHFENSLSRI